MITKGFILKCSQNMEPTGKLIWTQKHFKSTWEFQEAPSSLHSERTADGASVTSASCVSTACLAAPPLTQLPADTSEKAAEEALRPHWGLEGAPGSWLWPSPACWGHWEN